MKLTRDQIIDALGSGNYEINTDSACDCVVSRIDEHGQIDLDSNECWYARALYIDDELIAEYIQFDGLKMHTDEITDADLYNMDEIMDELQINDTDDNPSHDMTRILEDYFDGYPEAKFYRDNARGFANEYEIIADLEGNADPEDINDEWDIIDAAEAAREIAYDGDAATQAFNSFRLL
jgi:hypothetical protein